MKKFAKGTTTLLATALVFQSTPLTFIQAASHSQDGSNQLSALSRSNPIPSLGTQAVLECLTFYQVALQEKEGQDLEKLRQEALEALDFLDSLQPSEIELGPLLTTIAIIRQFDTQFPVYQPQAASWPKNTDAPAPKSLSASPVQDPLVSLLEASHQMDSSSQSQPSIVKKTMPAVVSNPVKNQEPSLASSDDQEASHQPSQAFQEESKDSSETPFKHVEGLSSTQDSSSSSVEMPSEDSSNSDFVIAEPEPASIVSSQSIAPIEENLEPAEGTLSPTATIIIEETQLDGRLTAWLSEDPNDFLGSSTSSSQEESETPSFEESHEPASTEPVSTQPLPIQTIEPIIETPIEGIEPLVDSSMEEMPSEEPASLTESPQEDSPQSQETPASNQAVQKETIPTPPVVVQEETPEPEIQDSSSSFSFSMMEEETDLAPIPSKPFSIFDYLKQPDASSLFEGVYPGLGIGPLPDVAIAALPVLAKDELNQNPQNFKDSDDVSAEGRPQDEANIQGIPEGMEEMDENDPSIPDLPPLPTEDDVNPEPDPSTSSKDPTQMDPVIVDVSDKDLDFDAMPDFNPSIIVPAPANPLLPDTNITSPADQVIVDSWASAPTVSTPTLSQSITVRQLTTSQNRRLKIANMGIISLLPNYEDSFAWKKAASPYNTPLLWGQCTWFAWGRFYDLYGFSPGFSGNGYDCVSQLLQAHGDKFTLSKTPASGAVFSSDVAHNHVGIVLDYDAEKDLLTIQEGNLDGISNSNWDEAIADYRTLRLSSSDIRTLYGDVTYAIPKEGTKFVGYEETEKALSQKKTVQKSEKTTSKTKVDLKNLRALCFEKLKALLFIGEEMEEVSQDSDLDPSLSPKEIDSVVDLEDGFETMDE